MDETKKILIVEDDADLVEAMKIVLEKENYSVITSFNTEDGYAKAKEYIPDLIILDVMFESRNKSQGFDYAYKIRQNSTLSPIPILMVTGVNKEYPGFNFSPDTDQEFLPVDDFIDKPARPNVLVKKTRHLLEKGTSYWVNWPEKG